MSLQIYILGSLWHEERHPYDIKKRILENTSNTVSITDGNLYYNFDALYKKGYLEKVETVQSEGHPDKSNYAITESGREALKDMIYKSFKHPKDIRSLLAPLFFVKLVDIDRILYMLSEAIEQKEQELDEMKKRTASWQPQNVEAGYEECYAFLIRYGQSGRQHELDNLKDLLGVIQRMKEELS
ncbi:PadR family transcriptional regulator [Paenibacillus wulumuqiensis]|uniref:PadR family transcriptional regulator n=1 Tax=Paenibacillus wulumuqiensis TaxID=1567107 RepID=UPI000698CF4E|nr:PadR family transcriptional regulator [Paenibacillus wulumuqiensis]